jgi:hypothetical protein
MSHSLSHITNHIYSHLFTYTLTNLLTNSLTNSKGKKLRTHLLPGEGMSLRGGEERGTLEGGRGRRRLEEWLPPRGAANQVSHPVLERNRMHLICALGSSSAHMIDNTSVCPKQCLNEREYQSTLLHDRKF